MADIKAGQTVWLVAKTLAAPPVCFKNISGVVVDVDGLYLVVQTPKDGAHRIHVDNIARTDPGARRERRVQPPTRLSDRWSAGYSEVTLW